MQENPTPIPLWRQLQGAASLLQAVREGQSLTAALERVDAPLRPGVQALAFHTMRWLGRAEALRQQLAQRPPPAPADALLCVALALTCSEHETPYTMHTLVDQAVEAAKRSEAMHHQATFINGCLRRYLREQDALQAKADHKPQAVWNHPQWWIDRVRKDHPEQWQEILQANQQQPPLILRINSRKTTQAQYLQALAAMDLIASPVGDYGVILDRAMPVASLPGFAQGHFSVQDAAAQWAAPLLLAQLQPASDGRPRLKILDACAAPGGKTAHLLELADADVTALEIDPLRSQRIDQNLARLGLQAQVVVGDAGAPATWWDGQLYDGILLDAPCTASGIVRRHPDVRWLRRPPDITKLAALQMQLLDALWPLLRPGGRLLYCTCSVFKAEGQLQAQAFVARHTDAQWIPSPGHLLPQGHTQEPVFPDNLMRDHDGFFYASFDKRVP